MGDLTYPLHVIFEGGEDADGDPVEGYEIHGPFQRPGALYAWAKRECYLNVYVALRDDLNALIRKNAAAGWRAIKVALDEWAQHDLEEYDFPDAGCTQVVQGDGAWRAWQRKQGEGGEGNDYPPLERWRAVGPIRSCGCEDWPCCVHADDYAYVP